MCNLWVYAKGGWGRRKAGDWGRKSGRGRGIAAGLPPFPLYDVENVLKVRTGESGYDALQDD